MMQEVPPKTVRFETGPYFLDLDRVCPGDAVVRRRDPEQGLGWLHFSTPSSVEVARRVGEVQGLLNRVQEQADQGAYSVGYLAYECGPAFDPGLTARMSKSDVLAAFSIFDRLPVFHKELEPVHVEEDLELVGSDHDRDSFGAAFQIVKRHLSVGDAYQVNLSQRLRFVTSASGIRLFASRCGVQPPTYATYLSSPEWEILSLSPELLLDQRGSMVRTSPMKGTCSAELGWEAGLEMTADEKTRAENLMIVDMVRNDLGRIAEFGSVETTDLFRLERHRTVYQLTSTVRARTHLPPVDVLRSVFPAASITGAPKVTASRIISDVELSPRNAYCGAIGYVGPDREALFSVGIRTARLDRDGRGDYGIGSGIVWDSVEQAEFDECELKSRVLWQPAPQWELKEALGPHARENGLVAKHMSRMQGSAARLGIEADLKEIFSHVQNELNTVQDGQKIVVSLGRDGRWSISRKNSLIVKPELKAKLANSPISSVDASLSIKSSSRQIYEHLLEMPDVDDVLMFNEKGAVTEFTNGAVLVRVGEDLVTPRPSCGCLPSVSALDLVEKGRASFGEIAVSSLSATSDLWLVNSVVGLRPVRLVSGKRGLVTQSPLLNSPA